MRSMLYWYYQEERGTGMAYAKAIELNSDDVEYLQSLVRTRTIQAQVVDRAKMLLYKAKGESNRSIATRLDVNINTVNLCLSKFKEGGMQRALFACQRPADLGYSQELWTLKNLHQHIQNHAEEAGFPRLKTITKPMVQKILKRCDIKPFKIKYYCERRDPDFESKMHDVLVVYKQVSMQFDKEGSIIIPPDQPMVHTISCDEKPGIQAIATTSEDLRPKDGNGCLYRDYEYKRLGTLSLLAAIDLQTGEAIPLVRDKHSSKEYIEFLKLLDNKYPKGDKVRIVLDNLKVHTSEATRKYLTTVPGRFEFVFTPKHGSWLNMVEGFFSKMIRQMLRGIRVKSKEELTNRIYKYFAEINEEPIVFHWKYNLDDIDVSEEIIVDTLPVKKSS